MKVMRGIVAAALAGQLLVSAAISPVGAAVYMPDGQAGGILPDIEGVSGLELESDDTIGEWKTDADSLPADEDGTFDLSTEAPGISGNRILDSMDREAEQENEEIPQGTEDAESINLQDQEELDRALAEGLVQFVPSEEDTSEEYARAGAASGGDLISVAVRELGVSGRPNKYTYWLGTIGGTYSYAWCHAFVSWCGAQAGAGGRIPKTASCFYGVQEFKAQGRWQNRISGYVPKAGDIIYFDWNANGGYDHVGIVDYVSGGRVHTIEGNAGDAVRIDGGRIGGYALTDSQIIGYGTPLYSSSSNIQGCLDSVSGGTNSVKVRGWAFDRDAPMQVLDMHIYVGGPADSGVPCYVIQADKTREDVGAVYPGTGSSHGFDESVIVGPSGNQPVYVYAIGAGQGTSNSLIGYGMANIVADTQKPVIKSVKVSDISAEGYTVTCKVSDNMGIDKVLFPSWHDSQTGDQAVWLEGTVENGKAECFIPIGRLGSQSGVYTTHIYAYDLVGNYSMAAAKEVTIDLASLEFYKQQNISTDFDALIESGSRQKVLAAQEDKSLLASYAAEDMDSQLWVWKRERGSSYSIQLKSDGRYLAASHMDAGADILLSSDGNRQLWNVHRAGEDSYYLKPENSADCVLTVRQTEGSGQEMAVLDTFQALEEQRFKIRKMSTNVTDIVLDSSEITFTAAGQTKAIQASIQPQGAADEKLCWQSSNEKVASVDKDGKVTAVGNGTADIKASTEDGSLSVTCKATVAIQVTGIQLNKQQIKLTSKGAGKKLSAAVTPGNAYDRTVIWSSSDPEVAAVSQSGMVTALSDGTTEITAQTAQGEMKAGCKVTVQIPQVGAGGKVTSGKYTYSADFIQDTSGCKTVIYRQKNGGSKTKVAQVSGEAYLKLVYKKNLYYEKDAGSGKRNLCAMDTQTFAKKTVRSNAVIAGAYGKRFLVMPYSAQPMPQSCYLLDVATGKTKLVSPKCLGACITSSKIYYVEAVSDKTAKGWKARVRSCSLSVTNGKYLTGKINVASCEKLTSKYLVYQYGKSRYRYKYATGQKEKL